MESNITVICIENKDRERVEQLLLSNGVARYILGDFFVKLNRDHVNILEYGYSEGIQDLALVECWRRTNKWA